MNNQSRFVYLAMMAVILTTLSWAGRSQPHGDPAAMANIRAAFAREPHAVGILAPVALTTGEPTTAAAVHARLSVSPRVSVRVKEQSPRHFLIMPKSAWPEKTRVTLNWAGSRARATLSVDDNRILQVDLATQTLVAWEDGRVVKTVRVATGVSPQWVTPTGTFWIYRRVRDDHMVGGKPGEPDHWDVEHVPYAQYFIGGVAFHGAWWNHHFGRPVSHGCVQLPTAQGPDGPTGEPDDARWLWHFADIGTPVVVVGRTPEGVRTTAPLPYPRDSHAPTDARSSAS